MTEHPIIFSGPMVRAILAGTKNQTRRVISSQPADMTAMPIMLTDGVRFATEEKYVRCPFGVPGDSRLWVRETWGLAGTPERVVYRANPSDEYQWGSGKPSQAGFRWRPSIYMPRWASRITLEVTGVRVERLQEITEEDAAAEGMASIALSDGVAGFREVSLRDVFEVGWDTINGKRAPWASNPWVWVVAFRWMQP